MKIGPDIELCMYVLCTNIYYSSDKKERKIQNHHLGNTTPY